MNTFEDRVREMLERRADDVRPAPPRWQQLEAAPALHRETPAASRARPLVAVAAAVALLVGLVGLRLAQRDGRTSPPAAVDSRATERPPFDPTTSSAVWPVGADGTATSWFRTAFEETTRIRPPPSDDPHVVALAYLRVRLAGTDVSLDETSEHGHRTAAYRWRASADATDATGRVYLRRVMLPNSSFEAGDFAWVVVGATSDHLVVPDLRYEGGRLELTLARRGDATFATTARVQVHANGAPLSLGGEQGDEFDIDQPRTWVVPVAESAPVTVRAQLMAGPPVTLTEFRVDPRRPPKPGKSLANIDSALPPVPGATAEEVARRYLVDELEAGPEVRVEPMTDGSLHVRYESTAIGSGTVRMARDDHAWQVVAVVGDDLAVESMMVADDDRRITLSAGLLGRASVTLFDADWQPVGQGSIALPGVDMVAGLPVEMTGSLKPGTAPFAVFRVEGPRGTTVAAYCLPR